MNRRVILACLTIVTLVLGSVFILNGQPVGAQDHMPIIAVFIEHNVVTGFDWPLGVETIMEIDDPASCRTRIIVKSGMPTKFQAPPTKSILDPGMPFYCNPASPSPSPGGVIQERQSLST